MPWKVSDVVDVRFKFVHQYLSKTWTMTDLCKHFEISRKTGYKWVSRFNEQGRQGLQDLSRRARRHPNRTPEHIRLLLIEARQKWPKWGPKKIIPWLQKQHPEVVFPSCSTCTRIFRLAGLIKKKRRRQSYAHPGAPKAAAKAPNAIWTVDYKGQFKTKDGLYCYPLTVADLFSRFVLDIRAHGAVSLEDSIRAFERLFRSYGIPDVIRSDNGAPFASHGLHGFTRLNVWWLELGIRHQRITPASPQENGAHERMHRTLKVATCYPPRANLRCQQRCFNDFRRMFNEERPHEALDFEVPASLYLPSGRPYTGKTPAPEYPAHFIVKTVTKSGMIRHGTNHQLYISSPLAGKQIGLIQVDDGVWEIHFYNCLLAKFDEKKLRKGKHDRLRLEPIY